MTLRAAVVGVGAFGRHHARIWKEMASRDVRLVGLVDVDPVGPRAVADRLGVPLVVRVEDLPEPVDVASIAVPTTHHRRVAEPLLRRGVHCLVEKPLAGSSADAEALVEAAKAGGALLQVGLVERFNPVLAAVARLGSPPVFLEAHRLAPYPVRSADVGVVMDVMIHDLDILNHLVGEEALTVEAVGVPVVGPHEDIANARITFPSGAVANVTASRVSLQRMRRIRIFGSEAYLALDYDRREALLARRSPNGRARPGTNGAGHAEGNGGLHAGNGNGHGHVAAEDLFDVESIPIPPAEPLGAEIAALVDAVRGRRAPEPSGAAGIRALRLAERILDDLRRRPAPAAAEIAEGRSHRDP
jgi:predicted dehydrogenase